MLVPGTEMHWVTLGFIGFEVLVILGLCFIKFVRPNIKIIELDIILLLLLIVYNTAGGLLPDARLPGSYMAQEMLAYATGFLTPCYFPYYVYRGFQLQNMRFHVLRGVGFFLVIPFLIFCALLFMTKDLGLAKNVLVIPVAYATWVIFAVVKGVTLKYGRLNDISQWRELIILLICLVPWFTLPLMAYFDISQPVEVAVTNTGFILLMLLHLKNNMAQMRSEYYHPYRNGGSSSLFDEVVAQEVERRRREVENMTREEIFQRRAEEFRLTNREKEIVLHILKGATYKQVASSLFISQRTVAKHMQNIYTKTNVANKTELIHKLTT